MRTGVPLRLRWLSPRWRMTSARLVLIKLAGGDERGGGWDGGVTWADLPEGACQGPVEITSDDDPASQPL